MVETQHRCKEARRCRGSKMTVSFCSSCFPRNRHCHPLRLCHMMSCCSSLASKPTPKSQPWYVDSRLELCRHRSTPKEICTIHQQRATVDKMSTLTTRVSGYNPSEILVLAAVVAVASCVMCCIRSLLSASMQHKACHYTRWGTTRQ